MNALFVLDFHPVVRAAWPLGAALDLALWTDCRIPACARRARSGWRYLAGLWAALVVGIIAARKLARQPLVLRSCVQAGGSCIGAGRRVCLAWPVRCVWQWA